jgi:hypothetical protein
MHFLICIFIFFFEVVKAIIIELLRIMVTKYYL